MNEGTRIKLQNKITHMYNRIAILAKICDEAEHTMALCDENTIKYELASIEYKAANAEINVHRITICNLSGLLGR